MRKIVSFTQAAETRDARREQRCSICDTTLRQRYIVEERPSGPELSMEKWAYCKPCWQYIIELRAKDQASLERSYAGSSAAGVSVADRLMKVG